MEKWENLIDVLLSDQIKHLSFDFWNTIAFSNPDFKRNRATIIKKLSNNTLDEDKINQVFIQIGSEYNFEMENLDCVVEPFILYKRALDALGIGTEIDIIPLLSEIDDLFLKFPPQISDEFLTFYNSPSCNNITKSITSNTAFVSGHIIKRFIENSVIGTSLDFYLFSDIIFTSKPSPKIFEKLYE